MKQQKFVELYCDEQDGLWKLTVWTIPTKDFDPFECDFKNLDYKSPHIHKATREQRRIAKKYREQGYKVHTNTANKDSYFQIVPKWIVELIKGG